ncbi:MAG: hypothetical protein II193_06160 [Lachnospiraceae bacterium]|nr:hypothetical protein [Lachnospiraceae bacterium]
MSASAGTVLIKPKGEWNNIDTYKMLNLVNRNEKSYIAKKTNVGIDPETDTNEDYWQRMYFQAQETVTAQDVQDAFDYVFGDTTDPTALSSNDIVSALSADWDGSSSPDPTALSSTDVTDAVNTEWDGSSSADPEAMNSTDIENATINS